MVVRRRKGEGKGEEKANADNWITGKVIESRRKEGKNQERGKA